MHVLGMHERALITAIFSQLLSELFQNVLAMRRISTALDGPGPLSYSWEMSLLIGA